jgi:hypothetical protein
MYKGNGKMSIRTTVTGQGNILKTKGMREWVYENEEMTSAIYRFTRGTYR